jgi:tRNA pseudouridine32 synthase / 23S rRNA pseudouridine746 synthase
MAFGRDAGHGAAESGDRVIGLRSGAARAIKARWFGATRSVRESRQGGKVSRIHDFLLWRVGGSAKCAPAAARRQHPFDGACGPAATALPAMLAAMDIAVPWFDDSLIVVDKPTGLLAVPGRGDDKLDCVATRVQARWADARVVHRLDMATSGLMLLARGARVQRLLSQAFAERCVHKRYVAEVDGIVEFDRGTIELPLSADWPNRPRQRVDVDRGKPSTTDWQVLSRDAARSRTRLLLTPWTGRSHQLRVHLQAIGHAIVGDALYGRDDPTTASSRLLLHASRLELAHPVQGAMLVFESPAPF